MSKHDGNIILIFGAFRGWSWADLKISKRSLRFILAYYEKGITDSSYK